MLRQNKTIPLMPTKTVAETVVAADAIENAVKMLKEKTLSHKTQIRTNKPSQLMKANKSIMRIMAPIAMLSKTTSPSETTKPMKPKPVKPKHTLIKQKLHSQTERIRVADQTISRVAEYHAGLGAVVGAVAKPLRLRQQA